MKYDDDELAQAALLLADAASHAKAHENLPDDLEERLLLQGRAVAADVRFTTTKAAAIAVDDDVEASPPSIRRLPVRPRSTAAWVGWLAAAACFAFAVYEWRSSNLERRTASERPAPAPSTAPALEARSPAGQVVALLAFAPGERSGEVTVRSLPPNQPGEHYRVWLAPRGRAAAIPAGSFRCAEACRDRRFATSESTELQLAGTRGIWITHETETSPWAAAPDPARVVAASGALD
jgi:hypothetical protein